MWKQKAIGQLLKRLVARALPAEYKAALGGGGGDPSTNSLVQTQHPLRMYGFLPWPDFSLHLTLIERWEMGNMATEIIAFLLTMSGWILISSTLPTDYWKVSSVDGTVITTATFWSNLWKTCVTDSTGVSNCKDFPSMLALDGTLLLTLKRLTFCFLSEWLVWMFVRIHDHLLVLFPSFRECRCLIVRKKGVGLP